VPAQKGAQATEALGRSKGGLTTTIHTAVDGLGNPLRCILTPGQASDDTQAELRLQGLPAQHVIADKGDASHKSVEAIKPSGATAVIPPRSCVKDPRETDFVLSAERYRIECGFTRLTHSRALATRDATRARNLASLLYLAASMLWMK
jgi:transposase